MKNFLLLFCVLMSVISYGQTEKPSRIYKQVQEKHDKNVAFEQLSLFNEFNWSLNKNKVNEIVDQAKILVINNDLALKAYQSAYENITLTVPYLKGTQITLELSLVKSIFGQTETGIIENGIRKKTAYQEGRHYRGIVKGSVNSLASLSIFSDGSIMGLFSTSEGNFNLGKLKDSDTEYILYKDSNYKNPLPMSCSTVDTDGEIPVTGMGERTDPPVVVCKHVNIYWEGDYNLYIQFGKSVPNTLNYLTGLFNQMATLYYNDGMFIDLTATYVWTSDDPYRKDNSANALDDFKARWNGLNNKFDAHLAHLIAGNAVANGGRGFIEVLCDLDNAYAYSAVNGQYSLVPTYSWDVMVVSHETGHNFGSRHTHWCGWRTGVGLSCGSIDNCSAQEPGFGCTTCPFTFDKDKPGWSGTIMSYCHLTQRGIDFVNGFGPRPGAYMQNRVMNAACVMGTDEILKPVVTVEHTPICEGDEVFISAFGGTTYSWSGPNGYTTTTQFLKAYLDASYSGIFVLTISGDDAGCSTTVAVSVTINPLPDATITPAGALDFCLGEEVRLDAKPGAGLKYQWKINNKNIPGAIDSSYEATETGFYSVVVTSDKGCSSVAEQLSVQVHDLPDADIYPLGPTSFCAGDYVELNALENSGYTYQWKLNGADIPGANSSGIVAEKSGRYTVQVKGQYDCETVSNTIDVVVNQPPKAKITPVGTTTICSGDSLYLLGTFGPGYTYQWMKDGNLIDGATWPTYYASEPGDYTVYIASAENCDSVSLPLKLSVVDRPEALIKVHGSTSFCQSDSVLLDANTGVSGVRYQWRKKGVNIQGATSPTYMARDSGVYSVRVYVNDNCDDISSDIIITINPTPDVAITSPGGLKICEGGTTDLDAGYFDQATYEWSDGGDSQINTIDKSGDYSVTVTSAAGCSATSSVHVDVAENPIVAIDPDHDILLCSTNSVEVTASGGTEYHWNTGSEGPQITITEVGTYIVTVTNEHGCTAIDSILASGSGQLNVKLNGADTICKGGSVILTPVDDYADYKWNTGSDNASITVKESGVYTVTVSDQLGCTGTATANVVVLDTALSAGFTVLDTVNEFSQTIISITPQSGWTYHWEVTGGTIIDGQDSPNVVIQWGTSGEGTVVLFASNLGMCFDTLTSHVVIKKFISTNNPGIGDPYIYPNPANEYLYIKQLPQGVYRYSLSDAIGRYIGEGYVAENQPVSVRNLPGGVYFLKCFSDKGVGRSYVFKFVKAE